MTKERLDEVVESVVEALNAACHTYGEVACLDIDVNENAYYAAVYAITKTAKVLQNLLKDD